MKKEIKFRAWDLYNKKMIELGDLETISLKKDLDFANYEVMQFTRLLDKNGKEIYEGDIVKGSEKYGKLEVISWGEAEWLSGELALNSSSFNLEGKGEFIIVVGNIYENKDLLI